MKRRLAAWSLGALLAAAPALMPAPALAQDDADERVVLRDYYSGNGMLNRGLFDLAAIEYRKFLAAHPQHEKTPVARYGLGVCLYRLQQYEEATVEMGSLVELEEFAFAAEVAMILGQSHHALGQYVKAAEACELVLTKHIEHNLAPNAAVLRAEALYRAERYRAARPVCELFSASWPEHTLRERAELFWGLSDMALAEYEAAANRFETMTERFPDGQYGDQTALMLAQCLHRTTGLGKALGLYERVIKSASDEFVPDALYGLGLLMHQQGNAQRAGELADELLEGYPESPLVTSATLLRGRAYFDEGDFDDAFDALESIEDEPGEQADDVAYWLAKCELRRDDAEAAERRFAGAIERYAGSDLLPEMMYDRAIAQLRIDRDRDAMTGLTEFRKSFPEHVLAPDALQIMAAAVHAHRAYEQSAELCREFRRDYADHDLIATVDFLAAENAFLLRDYEGAVGEYQSFLSRHPQDEQVEPATFRLGMALTQIDRFDEASGLLELVIDGRDTPEAYWPALLALGDGRFQIGDWAAAETHLTDYLTDASAPSADDAILKLGLALNRQERRDEAITQYDRLIAEHEDSPHRLQAIFERGQALVALKRDADAAGAFTRVLEIEDESPFRMHALNHLGAIAVRAENYELAAEYFDGAASSATDPDLAAEALFQSGQANMALQRYAAAEKSFAGLIDEHSFHERRPQASALHAIALARLDRHERALDHIAEVERSFMEELDDALAATVHYEKAWCLRELDRTEEAATAYQAVLALDNRDDLHRFAMLELAELQADDEYYEGAASLLTDLLAFVERTESAPDGLVEQARYRLGVCQFRLERYGPAAETLDRFVKDHDDSDLLASASLLCGESLIKTGRHQDAATHLQRVVDDFVDDEAYGSSLLRLGEARATLGQWDRSEIAFATYLEALPGSELWFQAQFGLGWAKENRSRHEDAIVAYRAVTDRHQGPSAARAQFQIGECLYALKRFGEAAAELLKVDILYAYPEWSAASLYEAGRCFEEMANPVEARRQFELVINTHGDTEWARLAQQRLKNLRNVTLPGHGSSGS